MFEFKRELNVLFSYPKNIVLLLVRLVVAYGFSTPAIMKINDIEGTTKWFKALGIPLAEFFSYLVASVESLGLILLIFGLFSRLSALVLSCVMLGAIFFVHLHNGFSVANNGFEIPLYYLLFLLTVVTQGAGKYSLDYLFFKESCHG